MRHGLRTNVKFVHVSFIYYTTLKTLYVMTHVIHTFLKTTKSNQFLVIRAHSGLLVT